MTARDQIRAMLDQLMGTDNGMYVSLSLSQALFTFLSTITEHFWDIVLFFCDQDKSVNNPVFLADVIMNLSARSSFFKLMIVSIDTEKKVAPLCE